MLSRIPKRNLFTTSFFRCISKADNNSFTENKPAPQPNGSGLKELAENDESATRQHIARPSISRRKKNSINYERTNLEDSSEPSVVLFPGQGSQFVGMAKSLTTYPEAMDLFEMASEILGYDLLKLCLEGPEDKLDQAIYCQPAVMVTSLAALELLKKERPKAIESCVATAGFSSGEITSLVFAGSIPFDRAVSLVQIRAEAMQRACDQFDGGMATVLMPHDAQLKTALEMARDWCVESGVNNPTCDVAYDLFPNCRVIAGSTAALRYLERNMAKFKLGKIRKIPAYGAYHTGLMESAVKPFAEALKRITIAEPYTDVYSNVTGKRYSNPSNILMQLPKQIAKPVKWEQLMHRFYDGIKDAKKPDTFVCGPGDALRAILRNINLVAWKRSYKYGD